MVSITKRIGDLWEFDSGGDPALWIILRPEAEHPVREFSKRH